MDRAHRAVALLLFLLLLLPSAGAAAEEDKGEAPTAADAARSTSVQDQETKSAPHRSAAADEALYRQIQDTYKAAKKRARRSSFRGYCGAYVANQLVVLGINTSYLSASGKNTYDIYRNMDRTSGGYRVSAYGAKRYSLAEALGAIMRDDPSAENILVGFQKGVSKSGRKYGHVLFIHGIRDGKVYFSDSSARTIDDVQYSEGEPIVCSLSAFVNQYAAYKLDGVVHFEKAEPEKEPSVFEETASVIEETASVSSENDLAQG